MQQQHQQHEMPYNRFSQQHTKQLYSSHIRKQTMAPNCSIKYLPSVTTMAALRDAVSDQRKKPAPHPSPGLIHTDEWVAPVYAHCHNRELFSSTTSFFC